MSIFSKVGKLLGIVQTGVPEISGQSEGSSEPVPNNQDNGNIASTEASPEIPKTDGYTEQSVQSVINESKVMTTSSDKYANMTPEQKCAALEKAVGEQGLYLQAMKDSMKVLNRRNTLAVIELQKLVRDCEIKHPDLIEIIDPVMAKVTQVLNFKQPYDV